MLAVPLVLTLAATLGSAMPAMRTGAPDDAPATRLDGPDADEAPPPDAGPDADAGAGSDAGAEPDSGSHDDDPYGEEKDALRER